MTFSRVWLYLPVFSDAEVLSNEFSVRCHPKGAFVTGPLQNQIIGGTGRSVEFATVWFVVDHHGPVPLAIDAIARGCGVTGTRWARGEVGQGEGL